MGPRRWCGFDEADKHPHAHEQTHTHTHTRSVEQTGLIGRDSAAVVVGVLPTSCIVSGLLRAVRLLTRVPPYSRCPEQARSAMRAAPRPSGSHCESMGRD